MKNRAERRKHCARWL